MATLRLLQGDSQQVLKDLEAGSIDAVVTDPPYGLSFMGKAWDYDVPQAELWREVLRVLKPGGHLLSFFGSRTYHRGVVQIEDAGFEIRDSLMWLYGTGFPKSLTSKSAEIPEWAGTALKPAHEPIVLARKPLSGTVSETFAEHGTGVLNIDGSRIATDDGKDRARPPRTASAILGGGNGPNLTASPHNDTGRFPANVILDEEAAALLDAQTVELKARANKTPSVSTTTESVALGKMTPRSSGPEYNYGDSGGASRFFYVAKASRAERDAGCAALPAKSGGEATDREEGSKGTENPRAGAGRTGGAKNYHPTVKPVALMRYLVKLITPPGGTVLDPFMGSGTTGVAALQEGFGFIGIERDSGYLAIATARTGGV